MSDYGGGDDEPMDYGVGEYAHSHPYNPPRRIANTSAGTQTTT